MQYFDRKGLGFILGDFFINSSGHPDVRLMYLCHVHAHTFVSVFVSVTAFVVHRFVFALNSAYNVVYMSAQSLLMAWLM
jgi:hypothetical protein